MKALGQGKAQVQQALLKQGVKNILLIVLCNTSTR